MTPTRINRKLLLIVGLGIFVLPFLIFFVTNVRSNIYSANITVISAPQEVTLTYGDTQKTISAEDSFNLEPGSYTFTFSKAGFKTDEQTLQIDDHQDIKLTTILEPETDDARSEMAREVNQTALQGISDIRFVQEEEQAGNLPITEWLPEQTFIYSIDYLNDPENPDGSSHIVTIDAVGGYRQQAINAIESWGYQPADLKFQFINYRNPFAL